MEYQVPQFTDVEDKIVGPLGLKQFIYLAGGVGLCLIFVFYLPLIIGILLSLPVAGFALALAFYKVNGKPFVNVLESAFSYYIGAKLFLWKREENRPAAEEKVAASAPRANQMTRATPRLTSGKLHDLAWSLDVKNQPQSIVRKDF